MNRGLTKSLFHNIFGHGNSGDSAGAGLPGPAASGHGNQKIPGKSAAVLIR